MKKEIEILVTKKVSYSNKQIAKKLGLHTFFQLNFFPLSQMFF